jgi:hypothetical protein
MKRYRGIFIFLLWAGASFAQQRNFYGDYWNYASEEKEPKSFELLTLFKDSFHYKRYQITPEYDILVHCEQYGSYRTVGDTEIHCTVRGRPYAIFRTMKDSILLRVVDFNDTMGGCLTRGNHNLFHQEIGYSADGRKQWYMFFHDRRKGRINSPYSIFTLDSAERLIFIQSYKNGIRNGGCTSFEYYYIDTVKIYSKRGQFIGFKDRYQRRTLYSGEWENGQKHGLWKYYAPLEEGAMDQKIDHIERYKHGKLKRTSKGKLVSARDRIRTALWRLDHYLAFLLD